MHDVLRVLPPEIAHKVRLLDLLRLLQDGKVVGNGRDARVERTAFQKHVFSRVEDPYVQLWFEQFMNLPRDSRAEGMGPVANRIGAFAGNHRSKVVMGQRESTVVFSDILKEGIILLVSTASGTVGQGPAALMGGTVVSLVDSALREQEKLPPSERKRCLLVADEFQTITGTNWGGMFAEVRKYGCSIMLATQSMAVLERPGSEGPSLKSAIMANVGCLISYGISAEDAPLLSHQMGAERVTETDLVMLDPYHCYVRVTTGDKSLPVFSMKTAPPPEMQYGDDSNVEAVRSHMYSYTVDRVEALAKIDSEATDALWGEGDKIGTESVQRKAAAPAAEKPAVSEPAAAAAVVDAAPAVMTERSAEPAMATAAAPSSGADWEPDQGPVGGAVAARPVGKGNDGNPYAVVMQVPKPEVTVRERMSERFGEDVVRESGFAPELLEQLSRSTWDPGVRAVVEEQIQGRVRKGMQVQSKEYEEKIAGNERKIAELEAELELAKSGGSGPVAEGSRDRGQLRRTPRKLGGR